MFSFFSYFIYHLSTIVDTPFYFYSLPNKLLLEMSVSLDNMSKLPKPMFMCMMNIYIVHIHDNKKNSCSSHQKV